MGERVETQSRIQGETQQKTQGFKCGSTGVQLWFNCVLRTGSEWEEDALVLEGMKQVADGAGRAVQAVLTASSFKGKSRECTVVAVLGRGAAVLTHSVIGSFGAVKVTHTLYVW